MPLAVVMALVNAMFFMYAMILRHKQTLCLQPKGFLVRACMVMVFSMLCVLCSCSSRDDRHQQVRTAAQEYMDMLLTGDCEGYVSGIAGMDSMPLLYRQQMVELTAQHRAEWQSKDVVRATVTHDSLHDSIAYVFIDVLFADSTVEQMGMKMILEGEQWKMR